MVVRNYSFDVRKKVVELRFGRYGSQAPVQMPATKIARRMHIKIKTVYTIIRTYVKNGYALREHPKAKQQREPFFNARQLK